MTTSETGHGGRWHVAHTHPRAEAKAAAHLRRQGFSVYLPQYLKRRSHARRVDCVPTPLFPRYVFVDFDPGRTPWRAIRSTMGVQDLVYAGESPASIDERIVSEIRAREDAAGFVALGLQTLFAAGDRITIASGALRDFSALFECYSDDQRVIILLHLLGRQVRLTVPTDCLAPAH